jgi:hypothetical protein
MPTRSESQLSLVGLQRHGVDPISGLSKQGLERSAPRETEAQRLLARFRKPVRLLRSRTAGLKIVCFEFKPVVCGGSCTQISDNACQPMEVRLATCFEVRD